MAYVWSRPRPLEAVGVYPFVIDFLTELIALVVLFVLVAVAGTVGRNRYGERIIDYVDIAITSIPGIGTVYGRHQARNGPRLGRAHRLGRRRVSVGACPANFAAQTGWETVI